MPERLECEVLQKARYINTLTFTFTFTFITWTTTGSKITTAHSNILLRVVAIIR